MRKAKGMTNFMVHTARCVYFRPFSAKRFDVVPVIIEEDKFIEPSELKSVAISAKFRVVQTIHIYDQIGINIVFAVNILPGSGLKRSFIPMKINPNQKVLQVERWRGFGVGYAGRFSPLLLVIGQHFIGQPNHVFSMHKTVIIRMAYPIVGFCKIPRA